MSRAVTFAIVGLLANIPGALAQSDWDVLTNKLGAATTWQPNYRTFSCPSTFHVRGALLADANTPAIGVGVEPDDSLQGRVQVALASGAPISAVGLENAYLEDWTARVQEVRPCEISVPALVKDSKTSRLVLHLRTEPAKPVIAHFGSHPWVVPPGANVYSGHFIDYVGFRHVLADYVQTIGWADIPASETAHGSKGDFFITPDGLRNHLEVTGGVLPPGSPDEKQSFDDKRIAAFRIKVSAEGVITEAEALTDPAKSAKLAKMAESLRFKPFHPVSTPAYPVQNTNVPIPVSGYLPLLVDSSGRAWFLY